MDILSITGHGCSCRYWIWAMNIEGFFYKLHYTQTNVCYLSNCLNNGWIKNNNNALFSTYFVVGYSDVHCTRRRDINNNLKVTFDFVRISNNI